ncbi:hypothetical protein R1flu_018131 [Riccia fluitans]|uniref:Uncharacterized protein n=1 Tax=Riccia fluitans TaxID=41844 RepID=A0ABD1ZEY3_9MARC
MGKKSIIAVSLVQGLVYGGWPLPNLDSSQWPTTRLALRPATCPASVSLAKGGGGMLRFSSRRPVTQRDATVNEESATQVLPITRLPEECPFYGAKARFYTCILPQGSPWTLGFGLVSSFWVEGDFN